MKLFVIFKFKVSVILHDFKLSEKYEYYYNLVQVCENLMIKYFGGQVFKNSIIFHENFKKL